MYFNEALDTIFLRLFSLRDYKSILTGLVIDNKLLTIQHVFYAVKILHKLSKFCYDVELYKQRDCALFAAGLIHKVLSCSLPNPSCLMNYGLYRLNEINKNVDVFSSEGNVKPADVMNSCIELSEVLIAYGDCAIALPVLALAEHISCDVCYSERSLIRSRVLKIESMAEIGLISEAMQVYYQIVKKCDMPNVFPTSGSINLERSTGKFASLTKEFKFSNNAPPEKNIEAITYFTTKLPLDKMSFGINNYTELSYVRNLILFKIFEKEKDIVVLAPNEKISINDTRSEYFLRVEKEMRDLLLLVNMAEDLIMLKWREREGKADGNDTTAIKRKMDEIVANAKITPDDLNNFYLLRQDEVEMRKERLNLVSRIRILISKVFSAQGMTLSSSTVFIKGIDNLNRFANKGGIMLNIEQANDLQSKITVNNLADSKIKQGETNKTGIKPMIGTTKQLANISTGFEAQSLDDKLFRKKAERTHPNAVYWLNLNLFYLKNMFKLNRQDDCLKIISQLFEVVTQLKDKYFLCRVKEIECLIYLQKYDLQLADESLKVIQANENATDIEESVFYTNYSEFLFSAKRTKEGFEALSKAKGIISNILQLLNIPTAQQSGVPEVKYKIDRMLKEVIKEREAIYGGGPIKKISEGKKKDGKEGVDINQINFLPKGDGIKQQTEEVIVSNEINTTNYYPSVIETYCKIELKSLYFQITNKYSLVENVDQLLISLQNLEKISEQVLNQHITYRVTMYYLFGKIYKLKFISDLTKFLNEKINNKNFDILTLDKEKLIKYSNCYNQKCIESWLPSLSTSRTFLEKSLSLSNGEFYIYENNLSLSTILDELVAVNFFICDIAHVCPRSTWT